MRAVTDQPTPRKRTRGNGEGGAYHDRTRKRWVGSYTVTYDGATRQQRRRYVTGKTKADVLNKLREAQRLGESGIELPSATTTVAAMLDLWLRDVLPGTVSPVTEGQYSDVVRLYINPRIGQKRVKTLAPRDVTVMLRDMAKPTDTRPRGYSDNAQRLARAVLRRALRWAETEGLVTRNVAALANPPRVPQPEGRTMTPDEARIFLDHIKGHRLEALWVVALSLGLRVSELLAVGWDDVNLDPAPGASATLTVRRSLKRVRGKGLTISETKTRTSRRTLHLPAVTTAQLRAHRLRQKEERLLLGVEWPAKPLGVDLVFRTVVGTALDPSNVWAYLSEATRHAGAEYEDGPDGKPHIVEGTGLGHWHPHELRHSAASLLLAQGVPLKVVSDMLGHSGINVTANVYSHVLAPLKDDAAAAMDRALGSGQSRDTRSPAFQPASDQTQRG